MRDICCGLRIAPTRHILRERRRRSAGRLVVPSFSGFQLRDCSARLRSAGRTRRSPASSFRWSRSPSGGPQRPASGSAAGRRWIQAPPLTSTLPHSAATPIRRRALISAEAADEEFVGELGERWELQNTYFKPYAACRFTHTAAEALAGLWETPPDAERIAEITVSTHREAAYLNSRRPTTIEEAQYSFPWVIASMVLDQEVGPQQINELRLEDPAMQSVAGGVTVEHDSTMDSSYPAAYPCV